MYQERFPNVGIHATIANMIFGQEFVDDSPFYVSIIIAILLSFFLGISTKTFDAKKSMLAGIITIIVSVGALLLFFIITKIYIGVIVPLTSVTLTLVVLTVTSLFSNIKEKSFLRNAFSRYLSPDVISEHTKAKLTPDQFIMRPLDRVRVVEVDTPIRLYELLEETEFLTEDLKKQVERWEQSISLYESRDFEKAKNLFETILKIEPKDQVAELYITRCLKFIENPPETSWDGVFNLTQK